MSVMDWISGRVFRLVHGNNLVYNTCWEDPRLDRIALDLGSQDEVLVITSAGCNALDYALVGPRHVYAVDMNPRQNALLELKLAGARQLNFAEFFQMFGEGRLPGVRDLYPDKLRPYLSARSQWYWDRWIKFFDNPRRPFYYRGTSGTFARFMRMYMDRVVKVKRYVEQIFSADSLVEQREIYYRHLRPRIWTRPLKFVMDRDTTLSMLGVPRAQRRQIDTQYRGGIVQFIQDCLDAVFGELPLADNYFWRVYVTGRYTRDCCPEYLKEENFELLRSSAADRVSVHTDSVQGFLDKHPGCISRFVLLDHMDWLSDRFFPLLEAEWQAIVDRAAPHSRLIWRSGGLRTDFIDRVQVMRQGALCPLAEMLSYHEQLASELHQKDRVHTYGSFYIAELAA